MIVLIIVFIFLILVVVLFWNQLTMQKQKKYHQLLINKLEKAIIAQNKMKLAFTENENSNWEPIIFFKLSIIQTQVSLLAEISKNSK